MAQRTVKATTATYSTARPIQFHSRQRTWFVNFEEIMEISEGRRLKFLKCFRKFICEFYKNKFQTPAPGEF